MLIVPPKGILVIAVVLEIALSDAPIKSKVLARSHRIPSRHLETVLQTLVHEGILRSLRGPHGGYKLARNESDIRADQILQAIAKIDAGGDLPNPSALFTRAVFPALARAEAALSKITMADLVQTRAEKVLRIRSNSSPTSAVLTRQHSLS